MELELWKIFQSAGIAGLIVFVLFKEFLAKYRQGPKPKEDERVKWKILFEAQNEELKKVHYQLQLLSDRFDKIDIKSIAERIEWIWQSHYKALDNGIEALAKNVEKQTEILSARNEKPLKFIKKPRRKG